MRKIATGITLVTPILAFIGAARPDEPPKENLQLTGTVIPARTFVVNAMVSGQVKEILSDAGGVVRRGQVLARLDSTEFELEFKHCQALVVRAQAEVAVADAHVRAGEIAVAQAEAAVREAIVQRDYCHRKLERMRELIKNKAIDDSVAAEAENQLQVADARVLQLTAAVKESQQRPLKELLAAAHAELMAAKAQCDLAKFHLDATQIHSPADGTVLTRRIRIGQEVHFGAPLLDLFTVADLSQLAVDVSLSEADYAKVKLGQ